MTGRRKLIAMGACLGVFLGSAAISVSGQEPKGKGEPAARHAVPPYFGQIGLSEEQREKIYKIQDKHQPKIDELESQIKSIREQMLKDCEGVLSGEQKKDLEAKRKAGATKGRKGAAGKSKSGAPTTSQP